MSKMRSEGGSKFSVIIVAHAHEAICLVGEIFTIWYIGSDLDVFLC